MFFSVLWIFPKEKQCFLWILGCVIQKNIFFGYSMILLLEIHENPKKLSVFWIFGDFNRKIQKQHCVFLDFSITA